MKKRKDKQNKPAAEAPGAAVADESAAGDGNNPPLPSEAEARLALDALLRRQQRLREQTSALLAERAQLQARRGELSFAAVDDPEAAEALTASRARIAEIGERLLELAAGVSIAGERVQAAGQELHRAALLSRVDAIRAELEGGFAVAEMASRVADSHGWTYSDMTAALGRAIALVGEFMPPNQRHDFVAGQSDPARLAAVARGQVYLAGGPETGDDGAVPFGAVGMGDSPSLADYGREKFEYLLGVLAQREAMLRAGLSLGDPEGPAAAIQSREDDLWTATVAGDGPLVMPESPPIDLAAAVRDLKASDPGGGGKVIPLRPAGPYEGGVGADLAAASKPSPFAEALRRSLEGTAVVVPPGRAAAADAPGELSGESGAPVGEPWAAADGAAAEAAPAVADASLDAGEESDAARAARADRIAEILAAAVKAPAAVVPPGGPPAKAQRGKV